MACRFYKDSVVTIFVDKSKRPFHLHLDLLCDASPFFKAAFAGNFKEASEKTMQLPDDHESTFELFADWLYCQRYEMLPREDDDHKDDQDADAEGGVTDEGVNDDETKNQDDDDDDDEDDDNDRDKDEKRYMQAFRLFVFADKYNVCKLKSNVIEALLEDFRGPETTSLPMTTITYAYEHTAQGSGLRRLLADSQACLGFECFEIPEVKAFLQDQSDFAVDIIISFAKKFQGKQTWTRNPFKDTRPEEYIDKCPGQENHSNAEQSLFLTD